MATRLGTATFALLLAACSALVGCPRDPAGDGSIATLTVTNAGQSPVRVGVDRTSAFAGLYAAPIDSGAITDLTPRIEPGESVSLPVPGFTTLQPFAVYAIGPDTANELAGPFDCMLDAACIDGAAQIVWTGSDVLCPSPSEAVVELVNDSAATVYLLADDEQPALPLLPLSPGESRFVAGTRSAGLAGSVFVRAVETNPVLGPTVSAYTACSLLRSCRVIRVRYDGAILTCEES